MSQLNWRLSPSIIERYFAQSNCLRALVAGGANKNERSVFGFAVPNDECSSAARAGNNWERMAFEILHSQYHVYGEDNKKMLSQDLYDNLRELSSHSKEDAYKTAYFLSTGAVDLDRVL